MHRSRNTRYLFRAFTWGQPTPHLDEIFLHRFPNVAYSTVQNGTSRIERHSESDRRLYLHKQQHDEPHRVDVHDGSALASRGARLVDDFHFQGPLFRLEARFWSEVFLDHFDQVMGLSAEHRPR
jgi:hypothetical protein